VSFPGLLSKCKPSEVRIRSIPGCRLALWKITLRLRLVPRRLWLQQVKALRALLGVPLGLILFTAYERKYFDPAGNRYAQSPGDGALRLASALA
jgi:hypothetical protein